MKYSPRSLMTFSIRDLFWITAVAALSLLWWTERSRLQRENWRLIRENSGLKVLYSDEQNHRLAASTEAKGTRELFAQMAEEMKQLKRVPTSQAPDPNQPAD